MNDVIMFVVDDCRLCRGAGFLPSRFGRHRYSDFERQLIRAAGMDPDNMPRSKCCPVCDCGEVQEK